MMVGYSSINIAYMENKFDLLYRNIWRKEANQTGANTYVHPRERPKGTHKNMRKRMEKTWL